MLRARGGVSALGWREVASRGYLLPSVWVCLERERESDRVVGGWWSVVASSLVTDT